MNTRIVLALVATIGLSAIMGCDGTSNPFLKPNPDYRPPATEQALKIGIAELVGTDAPVDEDPTVFTRLFKPVIIGTRPNTTIAVTPSFGEGTCTNNPYYDRMKYPEGATICEYKPIPALVPETLYTITATAGATTTEIKIRSPRLYDHFRNDFDNSYWQTAYLSINGGNRIQGVPSVAAGGDLAADKVILQFAAVDGKNYRIIVTTAGLTNLTWFEGVLEGTTTKVIIMDKGMP